MSTTTDDGGRRVALTAIRVPENVRALDQEHVEALAGSISLQGILVPLVVREHADGFELVAGFHRIAAAQALGLSDVPVVVRDVGATRTPTGPSRTSRASSSTPTRKPRPSGRCSTRGLSEDGAAQALGWPKTRVTARVKLLELPERAQQLIGEGVIALAAVDQLRAIGKSRPTCSTP